MLYYNIIQQDQVEFENIVRKASARSRRLVFRTIYRRFGYDSNQSVYYRPFYFGRHLKQLN